MSSRRRAAGGVLAGLAIAALAAAGCGGSIDHHASIDQHASHPAAVTATAPPAWEPAARSMVGADSWVVAGEEASRAVPVAHPTVLFVGDSITQWWTRFGRATWDADFAPAGAVDDGVVGDTTSNVLYRLDSGTLDGIAPRVVVILIGTNNIGLRQTAAEIARGVETVVDVVHRDLPASRILLLGLLPRDKADSSARSTVYAVNALLQVSPEVGTGEATYIDAGHELMEPNGNLRRGALHADLLHPTALGYKLIGSVLAPAVEDALGRHPA